ncbi:MAG: hypothetical protein L6Q33_09170, partial [Bacteriovoracaceae bacterium]|nr:hypothetical protein [Bacteriovoracaceae bacterium]
MKRSLFLKSFLCLSLIQSASAYDVVDRYKLIEDKLKTEAMMRPFGHDFILDINASMNKNALDFVDDVKKAGETQGSTGDKLNAANAVLAKYDKTEQSIKVNLNIGIPIFSFTAWDVNVKPNLRVNADMGANIGIKSELLTEEKIVDLFGDEIPAALATEIRKAGFFGVCAGRTTSTTYGAGKTCDVIEYCNNPLTSLPAEAKLYCSTQKVGEYVFPTEQAVPNFDLFAKLDVKAGLFNEFTSGEHFFGHWNIYGLSRTDIFQKVTSSQIAAGQEIELPKKQNTETTLQTDLKFGYKNSNYSTFLAAEEIKISKMKERETGSKEQSYGYDPLIRFHADALYRWNALSIQPFLGVHKRSGYGFSDGMYLGADAGAHVWGDRLGLMLRGMVDKQYLTLTPRMKLWLMQLEYSAKAPLKSTDGDTKLSA